MSEYDKQANDFAKKYGVSLTSRYIGFDHDPMWEMDKSNQPMDHWKCKLRRGHSSYTFDFWMGIGHKGKKPTMYDILTCLTKYDPGDFDEFCREYGYASEPLSEYPKVQKIWRGCIKEYKAMTRLFSDCLEELCEIQ